MRAARPRSFLPARVEEEMPWPGVAPALTWAMTELNTDWRVAGVARTIMRWLPRSREPLGAMERDWTSRAEGEVATRRTWALSAMPRVLTAVVSSRSTRELAR